MVRVHQHHASHPAPCRRLWDLPASESPSPAAALLGDEPVFRVTVCGTRLGLQYLESRRAAAAPPADARVAARGRCGAEATNG
jgi:hypothetical protein